LERVAVSGREERRESAVVRAVKPKIMIDVRILAFV
jgi:hypothetical protein